MNTRHEPDIPTDRVSGASGDVDRPAVLTVPNVLTVARIAGSFALLWLAREGYAHAFIGLFAVLVLTDWLDGKLAILLDQRTVLGARLDSIADVVCYACLVSGTAWLRPDFIRSEAILIAAMIASYALPVVVSLARFRRLPAYHTRAAKTCWLLVSIAGITLLAGGPTWPARVTLIAVIVTNVEALAISFAQRRWQADVPTIVHALRERQRG